ncbi:hypothetical protein CTDIVETGP_2470 [Clostridium tyrobutyricum DIVETGP]|uniref:Uncharacterized protein n=1 Tax=Clostridium tyrobutyricum DIVETGP TaxID=1408889 RepID=W6N7V2_CLOTY|nr:hypothetical protein CTK_C22520 [Clostridium tyrobutyricum]CDL92400.1 hypothetical protein CTDIVETGP_2470 [Clostridium tyrobutyricum DIVETGP]
MFSHSTYGLEFTFELIKLYVFVIKRVPKATLTTAALEY